MPRQLRETMELAREVLREIRDGVKLKVTLHRKPGATLVDFLYGDAEEFPFNLEVDIKVEE